MSQNVVLESQDGFPSQSPRPTVGDVHSQIDPIRSLTESMYRYAEQAGCTADRPRHREFDAQYWACWMVALVFPVLLAYLLLTG